MKLHRVGESVRIPHVWSSLQDKPFMQHCYDVMRSQHALPVPEDTSPAVFSKAAVNTHQRLHAHAPFNASTRSHVHTDTHSHGHILANTPKHTHYPAYKHTSSVSRTFAIAICEPTSFQGRAFTGILVFACTNCWVVQVYLCTAV